MVGHGLGRIEDAAGLGEMAERAVRPGDDPARHAAFWELIAY